MTRRCSGASRTGTGHRDCNQRPTLPCWRWTGSATSSSRRSDRARPTRDPRLIGGLVEPPTSSVRVSRVRAVRPGTGENVMTLRIVIAAAVLVSAYVHLREWLDGFRHVHVIGPLFLVNIVAGIVIAVLLVTWRHWFAPFLAFGFAATTLGGFVLATTGAGLFGDHEKWQGSYVWVAAASEAAVIVLSLLALSREMHTSPARQHSTAVG